MANRRDRFREIVETLTRHGLGFGLAVLGLDRRVSVTRGRPIPQDVTLPMRVRLALEDLGPTYIKFGQILSTRPDVLPTTYAEELAKLQDAAPPIPVAEVRRVIIDELGDAGQELLATLDERPYASASIGQVHLARLGGVEVVVKVRRPGVVEQIQADLEILEELAARASRTWELAEQYDITGLVDEFARTLRRELDYVQEAHNAERFAENFTDDPRVRIPRVFWPQTTSRVLTLERMTGIKITDLAALTAAGIDRRQLAERASSVLLTMVFEDGFFHADPHPGNFFVEANGRLEIIDFGMVGQIDEALRNQLVRLLLASVDGDADQVTAGIVELCGTPQTVDVGLLRSGISRLLRTYTGRPMAEVPIAPVVSEILGLLRAHHLRLPSEVAMLAKMIMMADGLGKQLDPRFDLMTVLSPYTRWLMYDAITPQALLQRMRRLGIDTLQLGLEAPRAARRLLNILERGGFDVHVRAAELEPLMDRAEKIGNRVVAGMIASALITAIGELVAQEPSRWRNWTSGLFAAGLGGVASLGGYIAWSSRRSG